MSDITFEAPNKFGVMWYSWYEDQVRIKEGYVLADGGRWEKKYENRMINGCIIQKTFFRQQLVSIMYYDEKHELHRDDGPAYISFLCDDGSRIQEDYYKHGQLVQSVLGQ